jgi:sulfoxide reductase heme-binding subunit YedZ
MMLTSNADWYLIRSSGVVLLVLLTAVMVLGISSSNRWQLGRQPRFVTPALHRSLSLLSVAFVAVHVVTTLLDRYAGVSLAAVFLPFAPAANAFWIGLGALSLDLIAALVVTSLLRRRLGYTRWRATHWFAYLCWPLGFAHSVGMGSDAGTSWFQVVAFACLGAVVVAAAARVLLHRPGRRLEPQVTA